MTFVQKVNIKKNTWKGKKRKWETVPDAGLEGAGHHNRGFRMSKKHNLEKGCLKRGEKLEGGVRETPVEKTTQRKKERKIGGAPTVRGNFPQVQDGTTARQEGEKLQRGNLWQEGY